MRPVASAARLPGGYVLPVAQKHLDRLSALDVSFLTNESSSSHMHVGGVLIFEGPPPSYEDLLEHVSSRLHLVPRFRQKLAYPPLPTGRPFWIDDPAFNLEYHVRHSALPAPGSEEQLREDGGRRLLAAARPHQAALGAVAGPGPDPQALRPALEDPPRARGRRLRSGHRHGAVRRQAGARAGRARPRLGSEPRALGRAPSGQGRRGADPRADRTAATRRARGRAPEHGDPAGERGAGGDRGDRLGVREPGAEGAAERRDRLPPPVRVGAQRPDRVQADQGRARRNGQRRRPGRGRGRASRLAPGAWDPHRGARAPSPGAGQRARPGRARPARQQARRDARPAPRLHRRARGAGSPR